MPKKEMPLDTLSNYLPDNSIQGVMHYLNTYEVHLTITRERKTVLGDYRNKHVDQNHRITVNGNLNKFAFLITLLHEIAHLLAYEKYKHTIAPHGSEWKKIFSEILAGFVKEKIFPEEITKVLSASLKNLAASSCADVALMRVLKKYDKNPEILVEEIPHGNIFTIKGGRQFIKGEQVRKRFKCKEIATGKIYLFSPVYAVTQSVIQ